MSFTPKDEKLSHWLAQVLTIIKSYDGQLQDLPEIKISSQFVEVRTSNAAVARNIWSSTQATLAQTTKYGLKVYVGRSLLGTFSPHNHKYVSTDMINRIDGNSTLFNSIWVQQNQGCLEFMASKGTISIHSADSDRGYPCLTVLPFLGLEEVLCKPINQLINQPAITATGIIGATKVQCIQDVLHSKGNTTLSYEMLWERRLWKKIITGIYLSEREVMIVTENVDTWQTDFWRSLVS